MKQGENADLGYVYCPNCARRLCGLLNDKKRLRVVCDRCGAEIYIKPLGIKSYIIKIMPKDLGAE